ncbi:MAG: hypothetical protein PF508_00655 [Spirochaeta sp.]|jgi:predicted ferric reductase|nr:hypothetical protein [Spirochaeta sp.]
MTVSLRRRLERPFWIIAYLLSPLIPLSLYLAGFWSNLLESWALSMAVGVFAYVWYLNQFIIAARPAYWEQLYGVARMYRFHGYMAIAATVMALTHVVIKSVIFPAVTVQQLFGIAAITLFVIVILATLVFMVESRVARIRPVRWLRTYAAERWRWQYHHLRRFHNLVVIAAFLVLAHVLIAFSTQEDIWRSGVMVLWFVVALGMYGWHKGVAPARRRATPFTVDEVVRENDVVTTVRITPPAEQMFRHRAGQFAYFRFPDGVPGAEEHPFTISSAPEESRLAFSAKGIGDFTAALPQLQSGSPVLVDGPYGVFRCDRVGDRRPIVMLAGGIGITPFLSMLGELAGGAAAKPGTAAGRPLHLIWALRTPDELFAVDRLREYLAHLPALHIQLFFSRAATHEEVQEIDGLPSGVTCSPGRISIEELVRQGLVGTGREFFVCGPRPMMDTLVRGLRSHGVPGGHIHFEAFAM